jgi:hypothetical protein
MDWQLKTVSGGRISLYSVAELGAFSISERLERFSAQMAFQPQGA